MKIKEKPQQCAYHLSNRGRIQYSSSCILFSTVRSLIKDGSKYGTSVNLQAYLIWFKFLDLFIHYTWTDSVSGPSISSSVLYKCFYNLSFSTVSKVIYFFCFTLRAVTVFSTKPPFILLVNEAQPLKC